MNISDNLNPLQERLYYPLENEDELKTRHSYLFEPRSYNEKITRKTTLEVPETGLLQFTADTDIDALINIDVWCNLPQIHVKDEYKQNIRIRWKDRLGHRLCQQAELWIDKQAIQSYDKYDLDIWFQWLSEFNQRQENRYKQATLWQECDTDKELLVQIPQIWWFNSSTFKSLLILKGETNVSFRFKITNIASLLIVEKLEGDQWTSINYSEEFLTTYKTITFNVDFDYLNFTNEERQWRKTMPANRIWFNQSLRFGVDLADLTNLTNTDNTNDNTEKDNTEKNNSRKFHITSQTVRHLFWMVTKDDKYQELVRCLLSIAGNSHGHETYNFTHRQSNWFNNYPEDSYYYAWSFGSQSNSFNADSTRNLDNCYIELQVEQLKNFDNIVIRSLIYNCLDMIWDKESKSMKYHVER